MKGDLAGVGGEWEGRGENRARNGESGKQNSTTGISPSLASDFRDKEESNDIVHLA